jgi:hypothetical protein
MSRLLMVAGGLVEAGPALPGAVSAYVVHRAAGELVRIFKVQGPVDTARVVELPPGTAVDLAHLQAELHRDLEPVVRDLKRRGGAAGVSTPSAEWVCDLVRAHVGGLSGSGNTGDV